MPNDHHERITRTLSNLRVGLERFVVRTLRATHGHRWEQVASSAFPHNHPARMSGVERSGTRWDIAALLAVIENRWSDDFRKLLGRDARSWINELRTARNNWAHQGSLDSDLTCRVIDSAERLLRAVKEPALADLVKEEKSGLLGGPRVKVDSATPSVAASPLKPPPASRQAPRSPQANATGSVHIQCLHTTYYRMGFFNVPVAFDNLVRKDEGPVNIHIEPNGPRFEAKVNRTANAKGTARIMGGVPLRDWFQRSCTEKQMLQIDFSVRGTISISKQTD